MALSAAGASQQSVPGNPLPNVLVVLADDVGPGDIEFFQRRFSGSSLVSTPNINRLIEEGMRFENARTPATLCAPTRWAVMTGNYNYRSHKPWGVWGAFEPNGIPDGQMTLGRLMKTAGYRTAFIGKWGFGAEWNAENSDQIYTGNEYGKDGVDIRRIVRGGPGDLGFDYSCNLPAGIQNVPYAYYENDIWMPLSETSVLQHLTWKDVPKGTELGKSAGKGDSAWDASRAGPILTEKAVGFIEQCAKDEQTPFFLYFCSQAVHHPHNPPKTFFGHPVAGTTPSKHLDMVNEFDLQVGVLIETLKKHGLYENTLFIVTSDNGGMGEGNAVKETVAAGHDSSAEFREDKGSSYEGGSRVPFIAVWPGQIQPAAVSHEPVMVQDVFATLAAVTGQKLQETDAMDSINLLPLLTGQPEVRGHEVMVVQGGPDGRTAIIQDGWKLIIQSAKWNDSIRKPFALFNLNNNSQEDESGNLINSPEQALRMRSLMKLNDDLRGRKERTSPVL